MKNIKKRIALSTALLGTIAPAIAPQTVEATQLGEHVFPVGEFEYRMDRGAALPLVIEMYPSHPDYAYLKRHNFDQANGRMLLYLQQYKDQTYYYSPTVRYLNASNPSRNGLRPDGTTDVFARHVLDTLAGTPYYPTRKTHEHNLIMNKPRTGYNPGSGDALGHHPVYNDARTAPARSISNLNIRGNLNFRAYTAAPILERAWTPNSLTRTANLGRQRHPDQRYTHGQYNDWGEFRQLGYHRNGHVSLNPDFPADGMRRNGQQGFENYPLLSRPWQHADHRDVNRLVHSTIDEYVYQWAMHNNLDGNRRLPGHYEPGTDWFAAEHYYNLKHATMTRLYDTYPSVRENLRRSGYTNRRRAIEALTLRYASLQSPPPTDGLSMSVNFQRQFSPILRRWYYLQYTSRNEPGVNFGSQDAQVRRQRVIRDGEVIQTFTRNQNGNTSVSPRVAPEVEPGQRLTVVTDVVLQDGFRDAAHGVLEFNTPHHSERTLNRQGGGVLRRGGMGSNEFRQTITVPETEGAFDIDTWLDTDLYISSFDMRPGTNAHTGRNTVNVVADRGNFEARNVELVDRDGNVVDTPVPGQEYKFRYGFRYRSVNGRDARRLTNIAVDYTVGREMVGSPIHGRDESNVMRTETIRVRPEHNRTYTFDSDYFLFETAQFDTQGTINVSESRYNENSSDNTHANRWESEYDIAVHNVRVLPSDSVNTQETTATALVQFDVEYAVPEDIDNIGQDVQFRVEVDGQVHNVTDHIRNGLNRNLSVPVEVDLDGESNREITAQVFANYNRNVYETDVNSQENNEGSATATITNPEIESITDSNNFASWRQYTNFGEWTGEDVRYNTFTGPMGSRRFLRFLTPDTQRSETREMYEQYQIDAVRFRSRLTRQEEMGENGDGWVNLLEEDGYIRAGYGYELEVDVSYKTNVFDFEQPGRVGTNGVFGRPRITEPLLQDNVYVEMPDGQLRSVQGDGGTQSALRLKEREGDMSETSWTFEIDGGTSLGAETVGRFYIGEDVEDGRYSLNVFTPRIRGANGKMTSPTDVLEHLLYDSAPDLGIHVIGSSVDDISDYITR